MRVTGSLSASLPDHPVWRALSTYRIGPQDASLSFAAKLARENRWSEPHAERVIEEYRRFCFLALTAGMEVTPSDAVDQAWHLHLTYSRDYWDRFCPEVLGKPLHHGPTRGGPDELRRHLRQYAETLKAYEAAFGPPPADIWPAPRQVLRDGATARRVLAREAAIVPKWQMFVLELIVAAAAIFVLWRIVRWV